MPWRTGCFACPNGLGFVDGGTLHVEIDGGVAICCVDADVSEPLTDRDEVNPGLQKMDRGAVSTMSCKT
jgi:hypothetical protein